MQVHRSCGGRFEERLAGAEVIRGGAGGHTGTIVGLAMRQTPDAVITQDVDCGVEDLVTTLRVGRHQFL
jgi:hypothetical protein